MKMLAVALFAALFAIGAVNAQTENNDNNGFFDLSEPNFIAGKGTFVIAESPSIEKILVARSLALLDNESDEFDRHYINMIRVHHEAGIAMSETILSKTDNAAIEDLANRIITANREDLEIFDDILAEFNETNATNETNASQNGLSDEDRVAESLRIVHTLINEDTNEWLASLSAEKAEFAYLKLMKEHHAKSIKLSQLASENLENETLRNLSVELVARQLSEIGEMYVIEMDLTVQPTENTMPFGQFVRSLRYNAEDSEFSQSSEIADENANNNENIDENISDEQISENNQNETSDEDENNGFFRRLIDSISDGNNSSVDNTSNNTSVVADE
jgi:uncharacterized protein (DUF305 family)